MTFACSPNCRRPLTRLQFGRPALRLRRGVGSVGRSVRSVGGVGVGGVRWNALVTSARGRRRSPVTVSHLSGAVTSWQALALGYAGYRCFGCFTYLRLYLVFGLIDSLLNHGCFCLSTSLLLLSQNSLFDVIYNQTFFIVCALC